jgi:hypothetical protein
MNKPNSSKASDERTYKIGKGQRPANLPNAASDTRRCGAPASAPGVSDVTDPSRHWFWMDGALGCPSAVYNCVSIRVYNSARYVMATGGGQSNGIPH